MKNSMKLQKSAKININYAAKIVEIKDFFNHPNPKCERLKCCSIDGYNIAVGIDTEPGLYIYFPVECQIEKAFLSANNLFRDKEMNIDKEAKPGFFEDKGRVKIIKLQGYPSEGFIIPVESLNNWKKVMGLNSDITNIEAGIEFDSVGDYIICKKYVVRISQTPGQPGSRQAKQPKGLDRLIENQFRFHYDTVLLKKCPYVISPNDIISITEKVHGTSGISAKIKCKYKLSWKEKLAQWIVKIPLIRYDDVWASRTVIKNRYINKNVSDGFYGVDVWGIAHKVIAPHLTKGLTVYYEIIGYLPNGGYIQKDYDYGYVQPEGDKYVFGVHYGIKVYRVTYTNTDGIVYEFSAKQVQQWCVKNGLDPVREFYYGYAKDLYPDLDLTNHWHENFLQRLCNDKNFYMEELSPTCKNKVPHEGIVLKIENGLSQAYKVKCIRFLEKEGKMLDKGEIDIESES